MNYAFVRLLLWFLIAVLPVQGFAAAVRTCCGPASSGAVAQGHPAGITVGLASAAMAHGRQDAARSMADAASAAAPAPSQHCADMPQGAQAIERGTATAAAYYPGHAAGHAHAAQSAHSAHDGGSCGVCAACCIAAVSTMPPALQVIPLFFDSVKVAAAPAALLPGHIPGGLERPPRHSFA